MRLALLSLTCVGDVFSVHARGWLRLGYALQGGATFLINIGSQLFVKKYIHRICPRGLMVRILPFQGSGAGSIPVGGTQALRAIFVAFGSGHGVMLFSHGHNLTFRYIE